MFKKKKMFKKDYKDYLVKCLVKCLEVWQWAERNPNANDKEKEATWSRYRFGCPACDYVDKETDHAAGALYDGVTTCHKVCPIQWLATDNKAYHAKARETICFMPGSPYRNWCDTNQPEERIRYARQVQDLIRSALQKLEEEEPKADVRLFAGELVVGRKYVRVNTNLQPTARGVFTFLGDSHQPRQFNYKSANELFEGGFYHGNAFYYDYGLIPDRNNPHKWQEGVYTVEAPNDNT